MTDLPTQPPTPEQRDEVVAHLSTAFAAGRLELEDLEQRLEIVMRARTVEEMRLTLAGLQAPPDADADPDVEPARVPAPPFGADRPKASRRTIVVMSGANRRGRWVLAPVHRVYALMGGAKLDLRDAELPQGTTEIRIHALMGGVSVIVPPDVDVEVDGWAFMGGIDQRDLHPAPLESQSRRVRIHARIVMGVVEVKVRERKSAAPAEPAMDQLEERRKRKKLRDG